MDQQSRVNARVNVVDILHHQGAGIQPTSCEHRYGYHLSSDESPYRRVLKVGVTWQPLDLGWFKEIPASVGEIHLYNSPPDYRVIPSREERVAAEASVLEVGYTDSESHYPLTIWEVAPGRTFHGTATDPPGLRIRSRSGECRVTLTVLPR